MRRRIAQIVSFILILSMLSTCVYATEYNAPDGSVDTTPAVTSDENIDDSSDEEQGTSITLAKPVITSLTANVTAVTLTFDVVEGAEKYVVAYITGSTEKQMETSSNTITILDLYDDTTYAFKVKAVSEADGKLVESEWSDSKSVTTGAVSLSKPILKIAAYNKGAILTWNKINGATGYEVWRCYNKKWSKIKTVGAATLKYKNTGLKLNKKYYYKVRALRKVNGKTKASSFSAQKSITAKTYLTSSTIKMGYSSGTLWKPSKKYAKGSKTKLAGKGLLPAGTKFSIKERKKVKGTLMVHIKLNKNGKEYWVKSYNIRYGAPYTTKDYTTEVKENFVNKKGYSSKTKYLLFVSHYTQRVYLFKGSKGKWDLQKTYRCATGKASTKTPRGVFKITKKAKRTPAGSKYVSYFKSWNAFHARPFGSTTMGKPASNGCIRLYDKDAIYIYKKIPKRTTVVSY